MNDEYDAWGKLLAAKNYYGVPVTDPNSIVLINPLRNRGYVYDDETGLYYLQSRYYDPTTCRFLNADVYCDTLSGSPLSTNMFAYCENCPLLRYDKNGKNVWWIQAPESAGGRGHSSLLIQQATGYWWYFYWSGDSIQMLFLGTTSFSEVNEKIKRFINVYNKKEKDLNLQVTDFYSRVLRFEGEFRVLIDTIFLFFNQQEAHGKKVYYLRFNPDISDSAYRYLLNRKTQRDIERVLSGSTHTTYLSKIRPRSMVITKCDWWHGGWYNLIIRNCMQISANLLLMGKFKFNGRYGGENEAFMRKVLYECVYHTVIPNQAFHNISLAEYAIKYSKASYMMYYFNDYFPGSMWDWI